MKLLPIPFQSKCVITKTTCVDWENPSVNASCSTHNAILLEMCLVMTKIRVNALQKRQEEENGLICSLTFSNHQNIFYSTVPEPQLRSSQLHWCRWSNWMAVVLRSMLHQFECHIFCAGHFPGAFYLDIQFATSSLVWLASTWSLPPRSSPLHFPLFPFDIGTNREISATLATAHWIRPISRSPSCSPAHSFFEPLKMLKYRQLKSSYWNKRRQMPTIRTHLQSKK